MHIKISRIAKEDGEHKAFTVKVNGKKFPEGRSNWYFCSTKQEAITLAMNDFLIDELLDRTINY